MTGLADGTVYYFAVKAYNTAGLMSGYSNEVSGQTSGGGPPVDCTNTPAASACVIGTDFNGDSQPDLIWQNDSTWQVVVWYMGGWQGIRAPGFDLAVAKQTFPTGGSSPHGISTATASPIWSGRTTSRGK